QASSFAREFERIRDLALRTIQLGQPERFAATNLPSMFIQWAKAKELNVPETLAAEVSKHAGYLTDWKTLYQQAMQQLNKARSEAVQVQSDSEARIRALEDEVA